MTICNWCGDDITNQSYFIRIPDLDVISKSYLIEVCPECHHHYRYAPPDLLELYKKRRNIK